MALVRVAHGNQVLLIGSRHNLARTAAAAAALIE